MTEPSLSAMRGAALAVAALLAAIALAPRAGAQVAEEVLEVGDVAVDVTAENAAVARDRALAEGQRKALVKLLLRLSSAEDVARLPPFSDDEIADMVLDFSVDSERVSAVRYAGTLAFRFRAEPVRRLLSATGLSFAAAASKPALVIPILAVGEVKLLWEDGNAWRAAWTRRRPGSELVPLVVPLGDLDDIAALEAEQALAGDTQRLAALAARYGTGDTLVALASLAGETGTGAATVTVATRRYGPGGLSESFEDRVTAAGATVDGLYAEAAERLAARVQEAWKRQNLVVAGPEQRMAVSVRMAALADWVEVRRRLAGIASVRRSDVVSFSRLEGRLDLVFVGDAGQLARALAQRDLLLSEDASGWTLALAGAAAAETQPPATLTTP